MVANTTDVVRESFHQMPLLASDPQTALLQVFAASVLGFFALYYACDYVLRKVFRLKVFLEMDRLAQADFLSRVTAQIHAAISTYFAYRQVYGYCSSGLPVYQDTACFAHGGFYSTFVVIFSFGYVVFDLIIILTEIRDFSPLGLQNIVHHLISITAACACWVGGGILPSAGAATVLTELSTVLLHVRFYMIKYKKADGLPFAAVSLAFVAQFFWSRIYILPQVVYTFFRIQYDTPSVRDRSHPLALATGGLALASMQLLNFFWFYKIVLGFRRVWKGGLSEAKKGTRDADELSETKANDGPKQE